MTRLTTNENRVLKVLLQKACESTWFIIEKAENTLNDKTFTGDRSLVRKIQLEAMNSLDEFKSISSKIDGYANSKNESETENGLL